MRNVSNSTFRPQIVGGEFVEADNALTWRFRYEPGEADALVARQ